MKFYVRLFMLSFVLFTLVIGGGVFVYLQKVEAEAVVVDDLGPILPGVTVPDDQLGKPKTKLDEAIESSKRLNILLMGTDGGRADTIMLFSFDPQGKLLDIVSVPRDTYNDVPGYDASGQKKINAVIGFGDQNGGPEGLTVQISKILRVPIHYYIKVDYDAVKDVVDTLGGVEVDVPFNMNYDDAVAKPPLHIHLEKGLQVLDGDKAIQFIRWRKNNGQDGKGDLTRITRQQGFIKSAIKKSLSFKLPSVVKTAMQYVETNMPMDQALYYASEAVGLKTEDIESAQIPGEAKTMGLSYYIHDPALTEEMMLQIYNRRFMDKTTEVTSEATTEKN